MNVLDEIIAYKRKEVEERKALFPTRLLEKSIFFNSTPVSLRKYLLRDDRSGIIAEFKRKSPSKGFINKYADVERTTIGYMQAGASALSVLTDAFYFGGRSEDLGVARKFNFCPILRKDFTVDEYQVIEAKSMGADAILLIAAVLDKGEIAGLSGLAHSLGMEVLLEIHGERELEKIIPSVQIVGVNNRDLKSMEVNLETSFSLAEKLPANTVKVSESGLRKPAELMRLREAGFRGFLMGEFFMRHSRPEQACADFIKQLNGLRQPAPGAAAAQ